MAAVFTVRQPHVIVAVVFLFAVTVALLTPPADGQDTTRPRTGRTRRTKAPSLPKTNGTSTRSPTAGSSVRKVPTVVPLQPADQSPIATGASSRAQPRPRPKPASLRVEGDNDNENVPSESSEEDYDSEEPAVTDTPLPTRPPPASVITAPMPGSPIETVFKAADEATSATCVAVRAGIRFTFSYVNASSGKEQKGVYDLPARNYSVDAECGLTRQRMSLIFIPDRQIPSTLATQEGIAWNLTLTFVRNGSEIFADRMSLRYVIRTGYLPFPWSHDASETAVLVQPGLFRTPDEEHSFICMSDAGYGNFITTVDNHDNTAVSPASLSDPASNPDSDSADHPAAVSEGDHTTNLTVRLELIEFYNLQLQAFIKPPPPSSEADSRLIAVQFSTQVIQCSGDFISVKVPFALGIVLLVFVIAVVSVYMTRRMMHGKQPNEKRKSIDYRPVH